MMGTGPAPDHAPGRGPSSCRATPKRDPLDASRRLLAALHVTSSASRRHQELTAGLPDAFVRGLTGAKDPARTRTVANAAARARRKRNARMSQVAGALVAALVAGLQAWNMADGGSSPVYCPPAGVPVTATVTATVTARARKGRPRPTPAAYSASVGQSSHSIP